MKTFLISALLLFVILENAIGQVLKLNKGEKEKVSGYLGMKNIVQVKGMFAFSMQPQKSITDDSYWGLEGITINKEFEINADRILTNRKSLGIVLGTSQTSVDYSINSGYYIFVNNDEYLSGVKSTPKITDGYFGLKYKLYLTSKGGLAPVGRYWAFNFNVHNYKVDLTNVSFYTTDNYTGENYRYKLDNPIHTYKLSELGIASGVNRIIGKRIVMDYGVQLGFLNSRRFLKAIGINDDESFDTTLDYIQELTLVRLTKFHFMKFYFSAGYIF
jgi:hypothetical protein